ncbi:exocyst complex component 4, partial [Lecanoromycetidae sp. Uapishka_2]
MADAGEIRSIVEYIWKGESMEELQEDPMQKQWLASQLHHFRQVVPDKQQSTHDSTKPQHSRQWSLLNATSLQDKNTPIYLPMTQETVEAFDSILASIRTLGTTALLTLHIDVRLGVIHMLNRTLHAPYLLAQPAQDPDPSILSLNADLLSSADTLSTHLPTPAQNFITTGLALLIDTYLVTNSSHITAGMNEHGCGRMQLNILVLSQNLKSIETSVQQDHHHNIELDRSARFFDLFMEGADGIVKRAKDKGGEGLEGFDLEELKTLVELWYRRGTESGAREVQVRSKRELDDRLLVLSEALWDR